MAQLVGQELTGRAQLEVQVLQAAADTHRPGSVAEVAAQLTHDGRHGEGGEPEVELRVEAIDRLHEREAGHLQQVVGRLASAAEAPSPVARDPQVVLDQPVAQRGVVSSAQGPEAFLFDLAVVGHGCFCRGCFGRQ